MRTRHRLQWFYYDTVQELRKTWNSERWLRRRLFVLDHIVAPIARPWGFDVWNRHWRIKEALDDLHFRAFATVAYGEAADEITSRGWRGGRLTLSPETWDGIYAMWDEN